MLSSHFKKIFLALIISSFATNSFAVWTSNRHATHCNGNTCHHTTVHKTCADGHCRVWKHNRNWHR